VDESWGPALNGQPIDQFTGKQMPFLPQPNNVRDYWKTGSNWTTNVAVGRATTNSNIRMSITHGDILSMAPGYSILRNNVQLKGGSAITDKLHANAEMTYMEQDDANRTGIGYSDDNPMQNFTWFGRQVDLNALRAYRCNASSPTPCVLGGEFNWNYNYHDNPFWVQFVNGSSAQRNRVMGDVSADYQVNDWITVTGKIARDWYRWQQHRQTEKTTIGSGFGYKGGFSDNTIYNNETNYSLMATATRQLTSSILMDATVGANTRKNDYLQGSTTVQGLTVPSVFALSNASSTPTSSAYRSYKEVRSAYGSLSLNYKGWWNVDLTGRNDWSSTLPAGHQSFFYPSISSAFVFTDALGMNSSFLSSGKIRASWTRVGNDTGPYQLAATLGALQPWGGGTPMFSIPNTLPNETLKPEQTTAWEVGTDLGFFDERLGFVLTYYDSRTADQIMPVDVSGASGYTSERLNAGAVTNKGWELLLRATPIKMDNGFRWDVTVNWAKNTSKVDELYGDLQTLVLGGQWSLNIEARKGYPYGAMFANDALRCNDAEITAGSCTSAQKGMLILSSGGLPQVNPVRTVVGNYTPDWNGGIRNRFSYGPWDLSVLVDGQHGGNVFSVTEWFGTQAGVLARTLNGRETSPTDPGIVVKGVLPDGSINGVDKTLTVTAMDYYHNWWGNQALAVDNASYFKLREVRLGYQLPASVMHRMGFSSGDIALVGRNLMLWTSANNNIDPETAYNSGNVQGIESGQFPSARSYGFSLSIRP
jgi:outer membrane receptor protein involved in Fe transport